MRNAELRNRLKGGSTVVISKKHLLEFVFCYKWCLTNSFDFNRGMTLPYKSFLALSIAILFSSSFGKSVSKARKEKASSRAANDCKYLFTWIERLLLTLSYDSNTHNARNSFFFLEFYCSKIAQTVSCDDVNINMSLFWCISGCGYYSPPPSAIASLNWQFLNKNKSIFFY